MESQIIQPYSDSDIFFDEQWIYADFIVDDEEGGYFNFYVKAPDSWSDVNKSRAIRHFEDFDIAAKYSKRASQDLICMQGIIEGMLRIGNSLDDIQEVVLGSAIDNAQFPNYWQKIMCEALIKFYQK